MESSVNISTNYCFIHEVCFDIGNNARQRVAAFSQVTDGKVTKMILSMLPLNIGDTYWKSPSDEAWESTIKKVAAELTNIKYLLPRDASLNSWTINKDAWPDVVWCKNIGEIPRTEPSRSIVIEKMKELDDIFSFGVKNKRGDNPLACIALLQDVLSNIGILDIKIV